jgi:hypothetical protein
MNVDDKVMADKFIDAFTPEVKTPTPKPQQARRMLPKIGRNELGPCGSGKKYKKCCMDVSDADATRQTIRRI